MRESIDSERGARPRKSRSPIQSPARRLAVALLLLTAAVLPRPATAAGDFEVRDHWARIRRAKARLAYHDFGNATKALAPIGKDSPAAKDAEILREQLRQQMAFRLRTGMGHFFDTQPFRYWTQSLALSGWATPWLRTEFGGASVIVPGSPSQLPYWAYGGKFGSTIRLFDAALDLEGWGHVYRWNDARTSFAGGAALEARWLRPLLVRAGQIRSEIHSTEAAVARRAFVDQTYLALALQLPDSLQAEARVAVHRYFDSNQGVLAYSWVLYPLLTGKFGIAAGYSGAYTDTRNLRFDAGSGRYTPYATPLGLYRHGPIARASLVVGPVTTRVGVDYALQASDYDPAAAYWGLRIRRSAAQWDGQGDIAIQLGKATLTTTYRYLRRYYYDHHEVGLYIDVPIT